LDLPATTRIAGGGLNTASATITPAASGISLIQARSS
jgi:hypothetical protein